METFKITFPVGRENGIAEALGIRGIPATVFITKDGRIARRHIGVINYAELAADIEAILR